VSLQRAGRETTRWKNPWTQRTERTQKELVRPYKWNFTIFVGTSEIQHLVIARAISGLHIQ
jgi:hypothetical protein